MWCVQVGSSVTLGSSSNLTGSFVAHISITGNHGVHVVGNLVALNAAITMIDDKVVPMC